MCLLMIEELKTISEIVSSKIAAWGVSYVSSDNFHSRVVFPQEFHRIQSLTGSSLLFTRHITCKQKQTHVGPFEAKHLSHAVTFSDNCDAIFCRNRLAH